MTERRPEPGARRYLIFNADDFGASRGVNRGIIECHQRGVVTSTSLMVDGRGVDEAVRLSRENPALAIGLHFDVWGEDERVFDTRNVAAVGEEFQRQLGRFVALMGRPPTHVDSHRHVHRQPHLQEKFREWVAPLGVPLRADGPVGFVGGYYGQWEWQVTELKYIEVPYLQFMLRNEVPPGFTEFSCHPGYVTDDYHAVYLKERETEVETLTDPRIRETLAALHIRLISYLDYARLRSPTRPVA